MSGMAWALIAYLTIAAGCLAQTIRQLNRPTSWRSADIGQQINRELSRFKHRRILIAIAVVFAAVTWPVVLARKITRRISGDPTDG